MRLRDLKGGRCDDWGKNTLKGKKVPLSANWGTGGRDVSATRSKAH